MGDVYGQCPGCGNAIPRCSCQLHEHLYGSKAQLMDEEKARKILGTDIESSGGLYCLGRYLCWSPHDDVATLDARFSADELEAIAWWMRNKRETD